MRDDKDDFWDIAALLPKKKSTTPQPYGEVTTVQITVPADNRAPSDGDKEKDLWIPARDDAEKGEEQWVYSPENNPFINEVRVIARKSHIHLFHAFKSEGALWLSERGKPTAYVPFFSFLPQYYQLNSAQKAYYLYFRDEANAGRYLEAGQSYVLLYLFEIINLPHLIDPKIGVLRLANAWAHYRKTLPLLDKSMVAWLADYALLHRVPCPASVLRPFLEDILAKAPLKEFYLGVSEIPENTQTDALILLTSAYRYQNSRYATGEHKELFYTHIPKVAEAVLRHVFLDGGKSRYKTVSGRHVCYPGALWADSVRYELEINYYSITGTDDLKILMTSVIKYAENKLRAHLSIKSRLSVPCLPEEYRILIDAYFSRVLPVPLKLIEKAHERPAYEALYEPLSVGVSSEEAATIEKDSWENTWRLIPEEEKNEIFSVTAESPPIIDDSCEVEGLLAEEKAFLSLLWERKDEEAKRYAKERALSYFALGERINEFFTQTMGDVVLLLDGDRFSVIADYENEIKEAIASRD